MAAHEEDVGGYGDRIFTATREGDWTRVRNLQKLMLRSRSNTLCSVRQVTQLNAGRKTAGVDGRGRASRRAEKAELVHRLRSAPGWRPQPVKRVYIPKANGKQRRLGIPTEAA